MSFFSCKNVILYIILALHHRLAVSFSMLQQLPLRASLHHVAASSSTSLSSSSTDTTTTSSSPSSPLLFTPEQTDFTMGYINKHHSDILKKLCLTFTPIGSIQKQKNAFSGGSYVLHEAKLIDIDLQKLVLKITVKKRNNEEEIQTVDLPLDSNPIKEMTYLYKKRIIPPIPTIEVNKETPNATAAASAAPMNNLIRKINRLCYIMNEHTSITGKLTQLGIQIADSDIGKVKKDLYLNQVPHNRYVRRYFYDMVSQAVLEAVVLCSQSTGNSPSVPIKEHEKISNRMKVTCLFPELNTSMVSRMSVSKYTVFYLFYIDYCIVLYDVHLK